MDDRLDEHVSSTPSICYPQPEIPSPLLAVDPATYPSGDPPLWGFGFGE
jgi:hypothetical protein